MSQLSEDDSSSDSSSDFLVPANEIDLDSTFFKNANEKPNPKKAKSAPVIEHSDNSDDEFDYCNDNVSSSELLSQVLKNLNDAQSSQLLLAPTDKHEESTSKSPKKSSSSPKKNDLSQEITNLLLQGETATTSSKEVKTEEPKILETKEKDKEEYVIPQKGVQIHLPGEHVVMFDRKKKKQQDLQKVLQSKINQRIRQTQVYVHKVGLLSWLTHGFYLNKLANDSDLLEACLTLVSKNDYPKGEVDLKYLDKFTKWFYGRFKIFSLHKTDTITIDLLLQKIKDKKIHNYIELIILYICTLRGMGVNCRLVISLLPPPLKPTADQLFKIPQNDDKDSKSTEKKNSGKGNPKNKSSKIKRKSDEKIKSPNKTSPSNVYENSRTAVLMEARKKAAATLRSKGKTEAKATTSKCIKKNDYEDSEDSEDDYKADSTALTQKSSKHFKHKRSKKNSDSEFSTDEEYVDKKPKKKPVNKHNLSIAAKLANRVKNEAKVLSTDDEESFPNSFNVWIEVYVESEERWISVNLPDQNVNCVSDIYKKASSPVLYIIAWNSSNTIKDVTRRYCPHWLTDTRKKRVEEKWWSDTLSSWKEKKTAMSRAEDDQLLQKELEQPLPTTLSACKGHPLYVIARHLLKFEALYPPDCVPLGHLKTGEAIYSRHCVHTLFSRETWVKRARVVKPAQEAYKIVKSMPKYDKLSGMKIKDQPLELFGKWQTTPYVPPEAKDGKVPRNEYGNVDLFKMCMLPKGCVYINLPALNRVARKLNIDCAPACTGFNFGCRGALPAFEGYVVCQEYEDTLRLAWEEDQIESKKRAEEKRLKRIYDNWKKLIKGVLIKRKLAAKYNFKGEEDTITVNDKNKVIKKLTNTDKKKPVIKLTKVDSKLAENDSEECSKKQDSHTTKKIADKKLVKENIEKEQKKKPASTDTSKTDPALDEVDENFEDGEVAHDSDELESSKIKKNSSKNKSRKRKLAVEDDDEDAVVETKMKKNSVDKKKPLKGKSSRNKTNTTASSADTEKIEEIDEEIDQNLIEDKKSISANKSQKRKLSEEDEDSEILNEKANKKNKICKTKAGLLESANAKKHDESSDDEEFQSIGRSNRRKPAEKLLAAGSSNTTAKKEKAKSIKKNNESKKKDPETEPPALTKRITRSSKKV